MATCREKLLLSARPVYGWCMDKAARRGVGSTFALKKVMESLKSFLCRRRVRRLAGALLVALGVACMFIGCTRRVYVPVTSAVRDTVYDSRLRADTLLVHDSVREAVRGDTVERIVYRFRSRVRTRVDTVLRTLRDTVRVSLPAQSEAVPARESWLSRLVHGLKWLTRFLFALLLLRLLIRWRR